MTRDQFDLCIHYVKAYSGSDSGRAAEDRIFKAIEDASTEAAKLAMEVAALRLPPLGPKR